MQTSFKDLQRVSMVTAKMGPVSERNTNEIDCYEEPGAATTQPPPKVQNVVLQQKLNENDLDKLSVKNSQRRDSQQSKGFLALTRYIRNSGSGKELKGEN